MLLGSYKLAEDNFNIVNAKYEQGAVSEYDKISACLLYTSRFGKFEFRPLEPGFGITVGNALRRILLSSLEGFAITTRCV